MSKIGLLELKAFLGAIGTVNHTATLVQEAIAHDLTTTPADHLVLLHFGTTAMQKLLEAEWQKRRDTASETGEELCVDPTGHQWSSGYQEDADGYDHEVAIYCLKCGQGEN